MGWRVGGATADAPDEDRGHYRNRQLHRHRNSVLPIRWKVAHSLRWKVQMLVSSLSLLTFILLLVMAFSHEWLYISTIRFHQRWPANISQRIYTSASLMSMGPLHICTFKNCPHSRNADSFNLWTNHPFLGVAKITLTLALALGFIFTTWLHLPYVPGFQKLPLFGWIAITMSIVTLIFFTLLLFPINIWLYELKRNLSIHIGWSYFIGWAVLILYFICACLCHFNNKKFWSLILNNSPPSNVSYSSSSSSSSSNSSTMSLNNGSQTSLSSRKRSGS